MRINIDHPLAAYCQPYLDGELIRNCIEADDEEGWVRCYKKDEDGNLVYRRIENNVSEDSTEQYYEFIMETLHGKVELVFNESPRHERCDYCGSLLTHGACTSPQYGEIMSGFYCSHMCLAKANKER